MTTLLDALQPEPVHQESVAMVAPEKRGRWHRERISREERQAADKKLAEQLRTRRQAQDAARQVEQDELLVKASALPNGVRVVGSHIRGEC